MIHVHDVRQAVPPRLPRRLLALLPLVLIVLAACGPGTGGGSGY